MLQFFKRQRRVQMLVITLAEEPRNGTRPVSMSQSVTPSEYRSERISTPQARGLLGASEFWCSGEAARDRNRRFRSRIVHRLRQAEVDNFRYYTSFLFQPHHDV